MSSSRIKNIIIIVLALLDIVLLAVWAADSAESASMRKAEIDALVEVLADKGIAVGDEVDLSLEAPRAVTVLRSDSNDNKLVKSLIDYSYREDMGGNVVFYSSSKGQASLRGTGEMVLIYDSDMPEFSGDVADGLARYMARKGLELSANNSQSANDDGNLIIIPCAYEGVCVYNSRLSFSFSGDKLIMIDGLRVFDGEAKVRDEIVMDSVSALMHFLDYTLSEGFDCSEITGLEAGYFMNVAVSGESSLRPVWEISTDSGVVYINAVSGKLEA